MVHLHCNISKPACSQLCQTAIILFFFLPPLCSLIQELKAFFFFAFFSVCACSRPAFQGFRAILRAKVWDFLREEVSKSAVLKAGAGLVAFSRSTYGATPSPPFSSDWDEDGRVAGDLRGSVHQSLRGMHKGVRLMIYYPVPLWKSKWILESAQLFKSRPGGLVIYENDTGNPARPTVCLSKYV